MAKKIVKKEVIKEVVVSKKKPITKDYVVKTRLKVSGKWIEVGKTIKLTEGQYRDFRSKKIV